MARCVENCLRFTKIALDDVYNYQKLLLWLLLWWHRDKLFWTSEENWLKDVDD